MKLLFLFLLSLTLPAAAYSQTPSDNPEMTAMFDADQAVRKAGFNNLSQEEIGKIMAADGEHRVRTRALLDNGKLTTGTDFWHAAFVFQHGSKPDDYLLAHSLAVAAAARGRSDASWIAAATLDRYLNAIGKPQVFGTQYRFPTDGATTQEPYDRTLLSDGLRSIMGVPILAEQQQRLDDMIKTRGK